MAEQQLEKAVALIKQGKKSEAIQIVKSVLQQDKNNIKAWWMMANLLEKPEQKAKAAQKILQLQPDHAGAKKLLASLGSSATSDQTPAQDMNYDWSKLQKNPAKAKRKSGSEDASHSGGIGTRIAIGFTVLIALAGLIILLSLLYTSYNSLEQRLERTARQFFDSHLSFDLERANNYLCREAQYSQELIDEAELLLSEIGDYSMRIDTTDLSIDIISEDDTSIRTRISGEMIGRLTLAGETREDRVELENYVRPDIGRSAGTIDFERENGRWRICTYVGVPGF